MIVHGNWYCSGSEIDGVRLNKKCIQNSDLETPLKMTSKEEEVTRNIKESLKKVK